MRIAPLSEVKAHLSACVEECEADGPIVITRSGRAVAVLLAPMDDDDLERLLVARSSSFRRLLSRSRRSLGAGKGLSRDEFWQAVADKRRPRSRARPPRDEARVKKPGSAS
jgi:prevent-host-death family protein